MRRSLVLVLSVAIVVSTGLFAWHSAAQTAEKEAVKVPLNMYLQAHATGNGDLIRKAFAPEARMIWYRDGKLMTRTGEEFAAGFSGKPAADEALRKRSIDMIDVNGTAATARITLDYPTVKFTDYFNLVKVGDEWKIVNKTFHAEPKAAPSPTAVSATPKSEE